MSLSFSNCSQGSPGHIGAAGEKVRQIQLGIIVRDGSGQLQRDSTAEPFIMSCNEYPSQGLNYLCLLREVKVHEGNQGAV